MNIQKKFFQSNKILNVYRLSILNVTTFMYKVFACFFFSRFQKPSHFYSTRFSGLKRTTNPQYQNE